MYLRVMFLSFKTETNHLDQLELNIFLRNLKKWSSLPRLMVYHDFPSQTLPSRIKSQKGFNNEFLPTPTISSTLGGPTFDMLIRQEFSTYHVEFSYLW